MLLDRSKIEMGIMFWSLGVLFRLFATNIEWRKPTKAAFSIGLLCVVERDIIKISIR